MRNRFALAILSLAAAAPAANAAQSCGGQRVPDHVRTCPNGDIPQFIAEEIRPIAPPVRPEAQERREAVARRPASGSQATDAANPEYFFGVWRTRIPGAVWTSPSGYQGYDWLHARAGVSAGDLIIKPDGTYLWQSYGGKAGRWVRGDAGYPIVLIDTVEKRQWRVGADPKRTGGRDIIVWDGNSFYYDGRR